MLLIRHLSHTILIFSSFFLISTTFAQSTIDKATQHQEGSWVDTLLLRLGADGQFNPNKGIDWTVMPGPFYTPEKEFGLGISAVGLYRPDKSDLVSQPSSINITGLVSTNASMGIGVSNVTYLAEDHYRLHLDVELISEPNIYHGQGISAGKSNPRIHYDQTSFLLRPLTLKQVLANTYLGVGFEISRYQASVSDNQTINEENGFPENSFNVAYILNTTYDTRDIAFNAKKGMLLEFEYSRYLTSLGSDSNSSKTKANYSGYHSYSNSNDTIAWQVIIESNHGEVTWDQLSTLGGAQYLRGYESGHFRDKHMFMAQIEYRKHIVRRHGIVYWLGAGTLADHFSDLGKKEWLPSLGIGYRFEIKQRVNLRLDLGFGDNETGFYFGINESF